ncbi:MAG: LUD domain-containing protein [Rhodospirillales bacterium]|nr:LUD domain-containing protein [Rhodospirillales bacterium]
MNAREEIMGRIGAALDLDAGTRSAAAQARITNPPAPLIPSRSPDDIEGCLSYFRARAEETEATTERISGWADLPAAVAGICGAAPVKAQPRGIFSCLDWAAAGVTATFGGAAPSDAVGLVLAESAAAETGTLVLTSAKDAPTALNFLPEYLIAVLPLGRLTGDYESTWAKLKQIGGNDFPARTVNWITGPSRSADIEQQVQMGVHGPRRLHIIVVDEDA